ncbi:hypothetical protein cyc_04324 [Cyclospora cayetanensis]|uniref:Uncharacterized protein n=1 Tax=Cyclospora cayetanensis TaxID=88456 RepID=A0A1D3D752_9EIME|nr:hypothetical protein cyc_04324 [Cyclospora cayetanensis]
MAASPEVPDRGSPQQLPLEGKLSVDASKGPPSPQRGPPDDAAKCGGCVSGHSVSADVLESSSHTNGKNGSKDPIRSMSACSPSPSSASDDVILITPPRMQRASAQLSNAYRPPRNADSRAASHSSKLTRRSNNRSRSRESSHSRGRPSGPEGAAEAQEAGHTTVSTLQICSAESFSPEAEASGADVGHTAGAVEVTSGGKRLAISL